MNNITRAKRVVRNLATAPTHFDALTKAGYAPSTANDHPKETINHAIALVQETALRGDKTAQTALEAIGITREQVADTLKYLVLESKNDNVRLAAVKPFARDIGVNYDEEKEKTAPPAINIGIIERSTEPPKAIEHDNVSQNVYCATYPPTGGEVGALLLNEKES